MTDAAFRSLDLTGKIIIVTGSGSGIGRAAAKLLAARGASVTVADFNDDGGSETVEQIAKEGGKSAFVHTDVSRRGQREGARGENGRGLRWTQRRLQ